MAARCPPAWLAMPLGALGGGGLGCVLTLGHDLPATVRPLGSRPRPGSQRGAGWARGQPQGQMGPPRSGTGRWPPSSRGRRPPLSLGKVTPHCTGWLLVLSRTEPCKWQKVKGQVGGGPAERGLAWRSWRPSLREAIQGPVGTELAWGSGWLESVWLFLKMEVLDEKDTQRGRSLQKPFPPLS